MADMRAEVREFLSSRRARLTPEQAGLPAYGGHRRVAGLRREEVAVLAGVSVHYYIRLERGDLAGASESVLDAVAAALRLDDAEREHLFDLARAAGPGRKSKRQDKTAVTVRPPVRQVLDAITDAPAWVRNGRHDIIAANTLGRALYAPVFDDPHRPVNTTRFTYLNHAAREFWRDYGQIAHDAAAMLRLEAGRNPHDPGLISLVGELSTQSELFRQQWASRDVKYHRNGTKRIRHPVVGDLDLNFESMELTSEPGLVLNVYTAPAGSPAADALKLLASWAATRHEELAAVDPATREA
jgi:transcriptional regulator with XRE-family HTH domain